MCYAGKITSCGSHGNEDDANGGGDAGGGATALSAAVTVTAAELVEVDP
jgi:hypothetical protein